MPLTKEQVKEAFRESMAKDYAGVPPANQVGRIFSPSFYAKMDAFIQEIRRNLKNKSDEEQAQKRI